MHVTLHILVRLPQMPPVTEVGLPRYERRGYEREGYPWKRAVGVVQTSLLQAGTDPRVPPWWMADDGDDL